VKKAGKILLYVVIILIFLAGALRLFLPVLAVRIANQKLPELLNTEASLGSLKLRLLKGYVALGDLRIAQPEGFGKGDLLRVPELSVKVKIFSLFGSPLTVEEVVLDRWEVNLVKDREGKTNLEALAPPPAAEPEPGEEPEAEEGTAAKPILVKLLSVRDLSFSYTDRSVEPGKKVVIKEQGSQTADPEGNRSSGGKETFPFLHSDQGEKGGGAAVPAEESGDPPPAAGEQAAEAGETGAEGKNILRVRIAELDLRLTDLLIDPAADPAAVEPAEAVLTARIVQEPFADGLLGLAARVGPVGEGIPPANAVFRLGGLELKPLGAVVPVGVSQVLGGSALDLSTDLALASYILDADIEVEVAGGHTLSLPIGGTPDEPEIDPSSLLFGAMLHLGGGVGRLAGNVGGAGYELAAGAVGTTLVVGEGAVGTVGKLGGGLFKTVTSAATGDLDGAVEGLSDATVGTLGRAAGTVGEAAGELADGTVAAGETTVGADADRRWREAVPRRWEEAWAAARRSLAGMPFPPPHREEPRAPAAEPSPEPAAGGGTPAGR